jgi:hypothetical protein
MAMTTAELIKSASEALGKEERTTTFSNPASTPRLSTAWRRFLPLSSGARKLQRLPSSLTSLTAKPECAKFLQRDSGTGELGGAGVGCPKRCDIGGRCVARPPLLLLVCGVGALVAARCGYSAFEGVACSKPG